MTAPFSPNRTHAVVIGCSFARLLAARVLSDHFERVTILERDPVHDFPESRRGPAQTRTSMFLFMEHHDQKYERGE